MRILLTLIQCILVPVLLCGQGEDQIRYSYVFTEKLKAVSLDFMEPVEGFYKVKKLTHDDFLHYDLVLHSIEKNFEMRFIIKKDTAGLLPHIECFNMSNTVAINDDHFDLRMQFFGSDQLEETFHADWGAYVDFIPKRTVTDKHFGRLLTLYAEHKGIIHAIFFFNHHDREKDIRMLSFSFLE